MREDGGGEGGERGGGGEGGVEWTDLARGGHLSGGEWLLEAAGEGGRVSPVDGDVS